MIVLSWSQPLLRKFAGLALMFLAIAINSARASDNRYSAWQLSLVSAAVYFDGREFDSTQGSEGTEKRQAILRRAGLQELLYRIGPDTHKIGDARFGLGFKCKADWEAMLVVDPESPASPQILAFAGSDFPDMKGANISDLTGDACDFYASSEVALKPLAEKWHALTTTYLEKVNRDKGSSENRVQAKQRFDRIGQPALLKLCGNRCRFHEGLIEYVHSFWFSQAGQEILTQLDAARPLLITGHSLGGAMAKVVAAILESEYRADNTRVPQVAASVTFGAQLIGDNRVKAHYDNWQLTQRLVNFVNIGDPLPLFPKDAWHPCADYFSAYPGGATLCNRATSTDYSHSKDPSVHARYLAATAGYVVDGKVILLDGRSWSIANNFSSLHYGDTKKSIDKYHALTGKPTSYAQRLKASAFKFPIPASE